jgi:hypothetical protein
MRRAITIAGTTAAIVVGGAATAAAAPPEQEVIPLVCDDGNTYEAVVNGNGDFTPARLLESTRVAIPTGFSDQLFRAVLPNGDVIEESGTDSAKGGGNVSAHNPRVSITCTFALTDTLEVEEDGLLPGTVVTFSGTVTGFLTGRG